MKTPRLFVLPIAQNGASASFLDFAFVVMDGLEKLVALLLVAHWIFATVMANAATSKSVTVMMAGWASPVMWLIAR